MPNGDDPKENRIWDAIDKQRKETKDSFETIVSIVTKTREDMSGMSTAIAVIDEKLTSTQRRQLNHTKELESIHFRIDKQGERLNTKIEENKDLYVRRMEAHYKGEKEEEEKETSSFRYKLTTVIAVVATITAILVSVLKY